MELETKYEPNQKVWILYNNKPVEKEIKGINITVGTIRNISGGIRIRYCFRGINEDYLQKNVFPTKEELINNL